MKFTLRAVVAALSIAGVGSAYAQSSGGTIPNTFFTQLPSVIGKTPVQTPQTTQAGQAVQAYVVQSSRGTWLFPPHADEGGNN